MIRNKILFSILFVLCVNCSYSQFVRNETDLHLLDFEQMKLDLFTQTQHRKLSEEVRKENGKCLSDLTEIGNGIKKREEWALKILDAWGKFPSALLEGNLYDFGGFSECFHIERNNKSYSGKYCMGRIVITPIPLSKSDANDFKHFSDILNINTLNEITPRFIAKQPQGLGPKALTFGMCLPASCSLNFSKVLLLTQKINISMELNENTCQLEEHITGLKTIDWLTIGLLSVVLLLIILSTSYDIFYTLYKREKSQALLAFSFYTNGMKLLSYKKSKSSDMMHCLHGIRVISTQWVVLGHSYAMYLKLPIRNQIEFLTFITRYHNMVIMSALVSVDTFFVLSGLLSSLNMLKQLEKTKGRINIPLLYFHRYLRLTPLLAVTILFSMSLMRFLGDGPMWPSTIELSNNQCERYWWSSLLYVQNYVNPTDICLIQTWYLSVDMQLFLFAPPVIYLLYRFEKATLVAMVLLVFGCIGCTLGIYQKHHLRNPLIFERNITEVYVPTHTRYSTFLIGIITGYIFFKISKRTIRIPKMFNLFAWTLSLAIMATVIFINYPLVQMDSKATPIVYGLYDALSRVFWAIALCYIIFACVHNSGGPINWFLGHPLWQPISRISYAIYILHYTVVVIMAATLKTPPYFSELSAFHTFIGTYILVVFIAIVGALAFESPIVVIEKILFSPKKKTIDRNGVNGTNSVQNDSKNI